MRIMRSHKGIRLEPLGFWDDEFIGQVLASLATGHRRPSLTIKGELLGFNASSLLFHVLRDRGFPPYQEVRTCAST